MADYTEHSVLFTPNGPLKGLAAIRGFFEHTASASAPDLFQAPTVVRQDIVGDVVYAIWHASPTISLASDTFVIRDDKIMAQTFVMLAPSPDGA
jgi:ketosteroid isomerase-like protein